MILGKTDPPPVPETPSSSTPTVTSHSQLRLSLNPDPLPRRKSTWGSGCKCLFITGLLFLVLFLVVTFTTYIRGAHKWLKAPHSWLYQNATWGELEVKERGAVVRPLVDQEQGFDVLATVWMRNRHGEKEEAVGVNEAVIFSGKVFEGLKLRDKHVRKKVELTVPTNIFKHKELSNYDLRASFVFIPTTPSLLDNLTNYSSWLPTSMFLPPRRPYPDAYERTMVEEAIDSFGVSIPLLEFANVHSRCAQPRDTPKHEISDEDEDEEEVSDEKGAPSPLFRKFGFTTTTAKPLLESHPYIITRTQLRVVDMTKLYNSKAYNKFHKDLKSDACVSTTSNSKPGWQRCVSHFLTHSNCDTRLQLEVVDDATGRSGTQWAYAPYLAATADAWGPKDLAPVPVNRKQCVGASLPVVATADAWGPKDLAPVPVNREQCVGASLPDEEYVNLTWKLSYSGASPQTIILSNALGSSQEFNMTDTEYNKAKAHRTAQSMQGLHGHQFEENIHPRRVFFLEIVNTILNIVITLLQVHYWYTRTSTIGISIPATLLFALSASLHYVVIVLYNGHGKNWSVSRWFWGFVIALPLHMALLLVMIKAVTRAEVRWRGWMPLLWFAPAMHRERASVRLDKQVGWRLKGLFVISTIAFYHFARPDQIYLIAASGPTPEPMHLLEKFGRSLVSPLFTACTILQLYFNHRSRTFAGAYKMCVGMELVRALVKVCLVLGPGRGMEVGEGYVVADMVAAVVVGLTCLQAIWMRGVGFLDEGDDDDEE